MKPETVKYGCHNTERQHGYWANAGYRESSGVMERVYIADRMSLKCHYRASIKEPDPRCEGCTKQGENSAK